MQLTLSLVLPNKEARVKEKTKVVNNVKYIKNRIHERDIAVSKSEVSAMCCSKPTCVVIYESYKQ